MNLKLFVWKGILVSYSSGIGFALAENSEQAREEIVISEHPRPFDELMAYRKWRQKCALDEDAQWEGSTLWRDLRPEPEVHDKPVGFYIYGGD